jgi:hypothetical protein
VLHTRPLDPLRLGEDLLFCGLSQKSRAINKQRRHTVCLSTAAGVDHRQAGSHFNSSAGEFEPINRIWAIRQIDIREQQVDLALAPKGRGPPLCLLRITQRNRGRLRLSTRLGRGQLARPLPPESSYSVWPRVPASAFAAIATICDRQRFPAGSPILMTVASVLSDRPDWDAPTLGNRVSGPRSQPLRAATRSKRPLAPSATAAPIFPPSAASVARERRRPSIATRASARRRRRPRRLGMGGGKAGCADDSYAEVTCLQESGK